MINNFTVNFDTNIASLSNVRLVIDDDIKTGNGITPFVITSNSGYEPGDEVPLPTPNQVKLVADDQEGENLTHVLLGWSLGTYAEDSQTHKMVCSIPAGSGIGNYTIAKRVYTKGFPLSNDIVDTTNSVTLYAVWKDLDPEDRYSIDTKGTTTTSVETVKMSEINSTSGGVWGELQAFLNSVQGQAEVPQPKTYVTLAVTAPTNENVNPTFIYLDKVELKGDRWTFSEVMTEPCYTGNGWSGSGTRQAVLTRFPKPVINSTTGQVTAGYKIDWTYANNRPVDMSAIISTIGEIPAFFKGSTTVVNSVMGIVALPVVENGEFKNIFDNDVNKNTYLVDGDVFSTHDANGYSAKNFGEVIIRTGNTQKSTDICDNVEEVTIKQFPRENVTLIATPKNGASFLGWYRREYEPECPEAENKTRFGYYRVSDSQTFETIIDRGGDLYNQYAALFNNDATIKERTANEIFFGDEGCYFIPLDLDGGDIETDIQNNIGNCVKCVVSNTPYSKKGIFLTPYGYKPSVEGDFSKNISQFVEENIIDASGLVLTDTLKPYGNMLYLLSEGSIVFQGLEPVTPITAYACLDRTADIKDTKTEWVNTLTSPYGYAEATLGKERYVLAGVKANTFEGTRHPQIVNLIVDGKTEQPSPMMVIFGDGEGQRYVIDSDSFARNDFSTAMSLDDVYLNKEPLASYITNLVDPDFCKIIETNPLFEICGDDAYMAINITIETDEEDPNKGNLQPLDQDSSYVISVTDSQE